MSIEVIKEAYEFIEMIWREKHLTEYELQQQEKISDALYKLIKEYESKETGNFLLDIYINMEREKQEIKKKNIMICTQCGVDRSKEGCPNYLRRTTVVCPFDCKAYTY